MEPRREPKPETWDDVQLMWPATKDLTATVGGEDELKVREMSGEYFDISRRMKALTERKDEIVDAFGILIGENSVLTSAEGIKFASSWTVDKPSVKKYVDLTDGERATVPEDLAERWKKRDEMNAEIAAIERAIAEEAVKIEALKGDAVKTGYRVCRPTKIKGGGCVTLPWDCAF